MATNHGPGKRSKVPCGVCQGPVVDGKDEALQCEGECGLWLHRGCASVPPSRYKFLSTSDEPFVCLCCSNIELRKELAHLRSELRDALELYTNGPHRQQISDLTGTVAALKMEVSQLKETLSAVSSELTSFLTSKNSTYASKAATRRPAGTDGDVHHRTARTNNGTNGTKRPPRQVRPPRSSENRERNPSARQAKSTRSSEQRERIPVTGVRRIWGTLRNTTPAAVSSALNKLTTSGNQLAVKKKFSDISGRSRWWFLVKGREEVLTKLQEEWEKVSLQTNWKLEPCTKPNTAVSDDGLASESGNVPEPQMSSPATLAGSEQVTHEEVVSNDGGSQSVTDSVIPNQSQASINHVPSTDQNQSSSSFLEIPQVTHSPPPLI